MKRDIRGITRAIKGVNVSPNRLPEAPPAKSCKFPLELYLLKPEQ
jgi:hypothetical protein